MPPWKPNLSEPFVSCSLSLFKRRRNKHNTNKHNTRRLSLQCEEASRYVLVEWRLCLSTRHIQAPARGVFVQLTPILELPRRTSHFNFTSLRQLYSYIYLLLGPWVSASALGTLSQSLKKLISCGRTLSGHLLNSRQFPMSMSTCTQDLCTWNHEEKIQDAKPFLGSGIWKSLFEISKLINTTHISMPSKNRSYRILQVVAALCSTRLILCYLDIVRLMRLVR